MARRAHRRSTSNRRRTRFAAATLAALGVLAVTPAATAEASPSHRDAVQATIVDATHDTASELVATRQVDGVTIGRATSGGRPLETYLQDRSDGFSVIAVLREGQTSASFDGLLEAGQRLEPAADGGLVVVQGDAVVKTVDAPWAKDAEGKDLATRYRIEGTTVVQDVDTTGATFPVVADPSVKGGFHIVPVLYVQYTWSETWYIKNHIPQSAIATALLCSRTGPAAPYCAYYGALFVNDVRATTDAAIAHKKCLKMRLPSTLGAVGLPAYDSYYVTCSS
ncbi:hypothetical protein [Angustibacter peucedani]